VYKYKVNRQARQDKTTDRPAGSDFNFQLRSPKRPDPRKTPRRIILVLVVEILLCVRGRSLISEQNRNRTIQLAVPYIPTAMAREVRAASGWLGLGTRARKLQNCKNPELPRYTAVPRRVLASVRLSGKLVRFPVQP